MKDNTFDIKVNIDVKVYKRVYYEDTSEKIEWESIENRMDYYARQLYKTKIEKALTKKLEAYFLPTPKPKKVEK